MIPPELEKDASTLAQAEGGFGLCLDQAELALYEEARKGTPWAVMYLLEHQARSRGYGPPRAQLADQEVRVLVTYASERVEAE